MVEFEFNFVSPAVSFECTRCAKCCSLDVMLSDREMEELGENSDREWRTTKKVYRGSVALCSFLEGSSCTIYNSRPQLCRLYPFFAILEDDFRRFGIEVPDSAVRTRGRGGVYLIIYDDGCPGIRNECGGDRTGPDWSEVVAITESHLNEFKRG